MGEWARRVEASTLVTADQHREEWSQEDLEFVAAFRNEASDEELATTLGRSLYAIWSIKHVLDERLGRRRPLTERQRLARAEGFDFVTTFPPGWWE